MDWNGKLVPDSIPYLEELLSAQQDKHDIDEVLSEIHSEYVRANLATRQLETARRRVENLPKDTLTNLALADQLSYEGGSSAENADEAKRLIVEVVDLARRQNKWVRYTLSRQAGIAKRLGDSRMFADALRALITDVASRREFEVDSRLFPEIVDALPDGFCESRLIDEYRMVIDEPDEFAT